MTAAPPAPETVAVRFRLTDTWYLCDAAMVVEVLLAPTLHPIPDSPPHLLGMLRGRGGLLPVFDLRAALGMPGGDAASLGACLVLRMRGSPVVAVDEVGEVATLAASAVRSLERTDVPGVVLGVARLGSDLHTVLDLAKLLQERLALALPEETMRSARQAAVPQIQLVVFRLGGQDFALDVFGVHEVLRWQAPTPVPRAPAFVEGVIDVRGDLIPVVDGRRRFELPDRGNDEDTRIVVASIGQNRLGLVVDQVAEVLRVPETEVAAPPAYVRGIAAEFVRGIVRAGDRLVILLDLERVLTSEERIALAQLADTTAGGGHEGAG